MTEKITFNTFGAERSTETEVDYTERIGAGSFGDIYLADVTVSGNTPSRTRPFAIKRFKTVDMGEYIVTPEMGAQKSLLVHTMLTRLGIPTWTTYRMADNKPEILMSLAGQRADQYIIDISKEPTHEDQRLHEAGII
ncbi:MAG: hypothetical protein RJB39_740 [Candidatus Parcubacteria bacterium]|jgi:hypothetical protein